VLGDRANLRVRVVAGFETRLDRVQQRIDLSRAEARTLLNETDSSRAEFIAKVFGAESSQAGNFDLTVNTDRMGGQEIVELVLLALVARSDRPKRPKVLLAGGAD